MNPLAPLRAQVEVFVAVALPLWFEVGLDETQGVFVEALSFEGQALTGQPRRARVQARQLYVLGLAHERREFVGSPQQHVALMERVLVSVRHAYGASGGGFYTLVNAEGQVLDTNCVLYDQAFYLMALAWLYRVTGKAAYRDDAERLWTFVETLCDPHHGGFQVGNAPQSGLRQQNPHTHLFEACLLCAEYLDKSLWLARADELYALFRTHFLDTTGPQSFLREFFTADWQPDPATGDHLDPGHHYEWTWLLGRYRMLSGAAVPELPLLYSTARTWGTDRDGLAYDEIEIEGRELRPTKRLWVQCEVLKGHLAYARWSGDAQALEQVT